MQHGYGAKKFLRKSYLRDRNKALEDRSRYTQEELDKRHLDVNQPGEGGGRTDSDTYEIKQYPGSQDASVRTRKKIDIRSDPRIGD